MRIEFVIGKVNALFYFKFSLPWTVNYKINSTSHKGFAYYSYDHLALNSDSMDQLTWENIIAPSNLNQSIFLSRNGFNDPLKFQI